MKTAIKLNYSKRDAVIDLHFKTKKEMKEATKFFEAAGYKVHWQDENNGKKTVRKIALVPTDVTVTDYRDPYMNNLLAVEVR